jgi:hypothetical protein
MARITTAGFTALILSLAAPAFADCGSELVAIDERLAAMDIAPEAREEVDGLRAAAAASCDAQDEATARTFLDQAKFLLGLIAVVVEGE